MQKNIRNNIFAAIIYILFFVLICSAISQKKDFYVDEIYTYKLSNGVGLEWQMNNNQYYPASEFYQNRLVVKNNNRFDYRQVWNNQKKDVHPPLYYFLVHTVSSLFPNKFSVWFAGIINIIFSLLTLFFLRKIALELTQSVAFKNIVSIGFILSAEILSSTTFLRMYVMAMFCITFQSYIVLKNLDKNFSRKACLKLCISTILGALTHYYCVLYSILLSFVYCFYLYKTKHKERIGKYFLTMSLSAIISIMLFYPMLKHIFGSYRARNSIENAFSTSDFGTRLFAFLKIINIDLLGGSLILIVVALIGYYIFSTIKHIEIDFSPYKKTLIILSPSILFFLAIMKSAIYCTDRYISPVFAMFFVCTFSLIYNFIIKYFKKRWLCAILVAVVAITSCVSFINCKWMYLYHSHIPLLKAEQNMKDVDFIYAYNESYQISGIYIEAINFRNIAFTHNFDYNHIIKLINGRNRITIKIADKTKEEADDIVSSIINNSDEINKSIYLGKGENSNGLTYYLY